MKSASNPPAFPVVLPAGYEIAETGMSLRDWFAGQALPAVCEAMCVFERRVERPHPDANNIIARCAYAVADAMLAERAKGDDA